MPPSLASVTRTPSAVGRMPVTGVASRTAGLTRSNSAMRDAVHAADRLEHRRLLVEDLLEHQARLEEAVVGQLAQRQRIDGLAGVAIAARRHDIARPFAAAEHAAAAEVAPPVEEAAQRLLIDAGQFAVERALVDRLRQQFGEAPAHVVDRLALAHHGRRNPSPPSG